MNNKLKHVTTLICTLSNAVDGWINHKWIDVQGEERTTPQAWQHQKDIRLDLFKEVDEAYDLLMKYFKGVGFAKERKEITSKYKLTKKNLTKWAKTKHAKDDDQYIHKSEIAKLQSEADRLVFKDAREFEELLYTQHKYLHMEATIGDDMPIKPDLLGLKYLRLIRHADDNNYRLTNAEAAIQLGISERHLDNKIKELKEMGWLKRCGKRTRLVFREHLDAIDPPNSNEA